MSAKSHTPTAKSPKKGPQSNSDSESADSDTPTFSGKNPRQQNNGIVVNESAFAAEQDTNDDLDGSPRSKPVQKKPTYTSKVVGKIQNKSPKTNTKNKVQEDLSDEESAQAKPTPVTKATKKRETTSDDSDEEPASKPTPTKKNATSSTVKSPTVKSQAKKNTSAATKTQTAPQSKPKKQSAKSQKDECSEESDDDTYDNEEKESLRQNLTAGTSKTGTTEVPETQQWCLMTYALPNPNQPFKGVYGAVKCIGTFTTEKAATKKAHELIDKGSRLEIKIVRKARTGAWIWLVDPNQVPASNIDNICTDDRANQMHKLMQDRIEQKARDDARKVRQQVQKFDEQAQKLDDPDSLEFYAMRHITLRQALARANQLEEDIEEMQKEIARLRGPDVKGKIETQITELETKHPEYKDKLEGIIKSFIQ